MQWNGASFGEEDIHAFPDPAGTDEGEGEGADAQANQESIQGGDNQLRLAGTNSAAIAAWTRVTETLAKEPGSAVTEDEQLLMMNSCEILASVWDGKEWVTTRLTQNSSADMAPVVAVGGGKALVAWRAVAASDAGAPTEFDSYDTIHYKVYDFNTEKWSGPYTLYNGTSGAVKGMEAQMTESGAMAVAYTIEKGSTSSTTRAVTLEDGTTEITSNLQTVFALIQPDATEGYKVAKNVQVTDDKDVNENPQLTAVKFDSEAEESFILGWHSVHSAAQLENSGRTVKVGLFSDPECTMPIESQYASFSAVSTGTRANGAEFTIDSTTDLAAIDQGAYAGQITMDLAAYAKSDPENYMENGEIRSGGVTVDVTFIPEDWPFVDVTEDKWYYDAVAYVYQQGIMVGMSETTFEPNTTVNRAQVVQMLYNLEGQPQVSGDSGFSDIRDDQWYAKAVAWASANDVVAGYEDGTFRPTRAVTREEFAQILYNYAKCKGYGLSASADLGKFPDSGQVSSWAETALGWANGNGLINGHDDGRLDPKGSTIRAQAASILMNFDKGFAQEG